MIEEQKLQIQEDAAPMKPANENRELGPEADGAMIEANNNNNSSSNNNNSDNHNDSKHQVAGLDMSCDLRDRMAGQVDHEDADQRDEDEEGDEEEDDDDDSMDDETFDRSEQLFYQQREQQHRQQQQLLINDNNPHNNVEDSTTNTSNPNGKEKPLAPAGLPIGLDLQRQIEEKFRQQDQRMDRIESLEREILIKLDAFFAEMPPGALAAFAAAQQRNANLIAGGAGSGLDQHQSISAAQQQDSNLARSAQLFDQLRNSSKLQSSLLFAGSQQQAQQRHDQNNNDCASNIISANSSISSSPSMSPVEPSLGQRQQHQQQPQQQHHPHLNNSNHQSLQQTILHNLQQHHHQEQNERHHHQHHHHSNNGRHTSNNQTGIGSRHSSASVSPSLGPASHHSTSATSPMLGAGGLLGGAPTSGLHEPNSAGLGGLNAAQAQQLLQAAVAAQQQHNNSQQQQDPNVAALVLALGQFGDPDMMQVQSRILASTLAASGVQHANDLVSQLQAAVKTSGANSIQSQAAQQSNALNHPSNPNNHSNNNNGGPNNHPHRNSHADTSSPLLSRHHHASQTALAHQLAAAANPINLGSSAAAMAAQLAAVARHGNSGPLNGSNQAGGAALQATSGGGPQNGGGGGGGGGPGQIVHSIPHPHSHHALSHPTASLLMNNPHYQTVRTKYSTRRYSRRRVGPEEAMADPAIKATALLKMPVVPKTILIVLKHRLTVQTAITLACSQTGERLRKGAIQKKLEAMFREPGAVDSFLAEYDHPR